MSRESCNLRVCDVKGCQHASDCVNQGPERFIAKPRPKARAKAQWKVEYEARIAGLSNTDLLAESHSTYAAMEDGQYGGARDDIYESRACARELTRRLTAIGFLSPPTPLPFAAQFSVQPDEPGESTS